MPPPKQARVCLADTASSKFNWFFNALKIGPTSVPFLGLLCSRHSSLVGNASHGFSIRRNSQTHVSKLSRGGPVWKFLVLFFLSVGVHSPIRSSQYVALFDAPAKMVDCWMCKGKQVAKRRPGYGMTCADCTECKAFECICYTWWVDRGCSSFLEYTMPDLLHCCIIGQSWQVCYVFGRLASVWNARERGSKIIAAFAGRNDANFSKTWSGFVASCWLRIVRSWLSSSICVTWRWIELIESDIELRE